MKISCIFLLYLVSMLFTEYSLYAAKFINKTKRSIILHTLDGTVIIDTLIPASDKIIDIDSCKTHVRGDKEYFFETIHQQESIIFAEINGRVIITRIETKNQF